MPVKPHIRNLGFLASALGIIQGLTWAILSLLVILIYTKVWEPEISTTTYGGTLNSFIFSIYLNADVKANDIVIFHSQNLFSFSVIYLVISLIWLGSSANILLAFHNGNNIGVLKRGSKIWFIVTLVVCVLDGIVTSIVAVDFNYFLSQVRPSEPSDTYTILAIGIVMTLAARGFILWFINLGLAVFFATLLPRQLESSNAPPRTYNQPMAGHVNPGFTPEREKPVNAYAHQQPYVETAPKPKPLKPVPYPKPPPPPQSPQSSFVYPNDRFAKIGPTSKSPPPPLIVQPPHVPAGYIYPTEPRVPSPDYSPPNSPFNSQLKSALKNRSQFDFRSNGRY